MIPPTELDPELKKVITGLEDFVAKRKPKARMKVIPSGPLRYVRIDLVLDERAGKDEIDDMLAEVRKLGETKLVGEPVVANVIKTRRTYRIALVAFGLAGIPLGLMATLTLIAYRGLYVEPLRTFLATLNLGGAFWSPLADEVKVLVGFVALIGAAIGVGVAHRRYAKAKEVAK